MPKRSASEGENVNPADMMAGYVASRKDEMLDAVITAAALVARADHGAPKPDERD